MIYCTNPRHALEFPQFTTKLYTTILQALPSKASEKYLQECIQNKVEPDIYKVSGMTSEEILTYFYETFSFKKSN